MSEKIFRYAIAAATSMGVRITPDMRQPVHTSSHFTMQATSAESNVLTVPAGLGLNALVLTKFVKDSPIAEFIRRSLRSRNIDYIGADVEQGGPWGYRHQFNIADSGFGMRSPRVHNDRAGEVGRTITIQEFDIERIFKEDGVEFLHLSGLFAALSPETGQTSLTLAKKAKEYGTKISFDLNYRASFWKGRKEELLCIFTEIAKVADILIGNEEDFQLCLGVKGPEAGGQDISSKIESFRQMIMNVKAMYPNAEWFATTLREVVSANQHRWGAILLKGDQLYIEEPREIDVLDRIGGGDGFVGGMLYGVLKGWNPEDCLHFGWATGAIAAMMMEDYAMPMDEDQVWQVYKGNARVKR
jgi:2-dehydro-3-deoxygluconokinase